MHDHDQQDRQQQQLQQQVATMTSSQPPPPAARTPGPAPTTADATTADSEPPATARPRAMTAEERSKRYRQEEEVGRGGYAIVYKGRDTSTNRVVAIKKIKMGLFMQSSEMGMDLSAIRELKALQELHHPNVVELIDVFRKGPNLHLVLEFLDTDLDRLIKDKSLVFQAGDIKAWMLMMMRGLAWCHKNWILHRDLKPNNLLISSTGQLKLADFGLARDFGQDPVMGRPMTPQVITIFYRPPELLLGAKYYSYAVDIWSAACIFAELMLRVPFLAGEKETDLAQLTAIFQALGTPTTDDWPALPALAPVSWHVYPKKPLAGYFGGAANDALALLERMFTYNPVLRPAAEDVLDDPYFTNLPRPTRADRLPRPAPPPPRQVAARRVLGDPARAREGLAAGTRRARPPPPAGGVGGAPLGEKPRKMQRVA
ncbi:TFIIH complex serine/threonine-protein kinase subunit kin28 [Allomyces arbusculus]|nr:TFIIH complex serine/threonine-protein kinase subunit kin28 [Allomyces arbusculus]